MAGKDIICPLLGARQHQISFYILLGIRAGQEGVEKPLCNYRSVHDWPKKYSQRSFIGRKLMGDADAV